MARQNFGRVITMSPAIRTAGYAGYTAYNLSKFGMSMVALGVHEEYFCKGKNITGNSLWPATIVESSASINFSMGERKLWRKPEVLADSVIGIICAPGEGPNAISGKMLNDEDFLRSKGLKDEDFVRYRCDPDFEPPRLLVPEPQMEENSPEFAGKIKKASMKRGSVRKLDQDKLKSAL